MNKDQPSGFTQPSSPLVTLTNHPLNPDHIIASTLRDKLLQAAAEVVSHPLALLPQVRLGFVQKLLRHVHHVHSFEQRQQQTLGDPPDAGATVQSAVCARLPLPDLQRTERVRVSHLD